MNGKRKRPRISRKKIGLSPGSVVFTGEQRVDRTHVRVVRYDAGGVRESETDDVASLAPPPEEADGVLWINVDGLHDTELIETLGRAFGVHPLALEDVVNVGSRPQIAEYEGHLFTSVRMLSWDLGEVVDEHVTLILGSNWLLSFQERPGDVFGAVRERMQRSTSRLRTRGADYLWYALLDAIVDHYIVVVGELAGRAEELEDHVWDEGIDDELPASVQAIRRESLVVRRALRPLREALDSLRVEAPEELAEDTLVFMRDLRDHVIELSDSLDNIRESLGSVMEAHLSQISMRANDVMKVLTIMASIFIPLTFIAGIYGMNFEYMPELAVRWAYPAVWAVMLTVGVGMLVYFWRKKWL